MSGPGMRAPGGRTVRVGGRLRSGALGRVVRAGVGRRRAQTVVMALTALVSVAASVLALGLLVASQAPFDRAFARQQGAHLTVQFDGSAVTAGQLADTARISGVAAATGPFGVASVRFRPTGDTPPGFQPPPLTVAGRPSAGGEVDRLALVEGRWATAPGEIVLEAGSRQPGYGPGRAWRPAGAVGVEGVEGVEGSGSRWSASPSRWARAPTPGSCPRN